jgi:uncharacterized short protein YbdD (DUF466 family)
MTAVRASALGTVQPEARMESLEAKAGSGFRERARSLCSACRQVFGIPDYERYLAHAAQRHPGAPVLPRTDFFRQAIDRRYGKSGPRCC